MLPCILIVGYGQFRVNFFVFLTKYEELDLLTIISELRVILKEKARATRTIYGGRQSTKG